MEQNTESTIPAIDQIANGENLQMYKALIPYLPRIMQKNFVMMIKIMEMNHLLSFYNSPMSACSVSEPHSTEELLTELRKYGSESQNEQLDQILNLISAIKLYQTYHE